MENKYFTPDIEDIHIGYECELLMNTNVSILNPTSNAPEFKPFIFEKNKIELLIELYDSIRVPYLTKEQIEAEGWNFETVLFTDDNENDVYSDGFVKHVDSGHWYNMVLRKDNKIHIVYKWYRNSVGQTWRDIYYGECKDINTFRKIIKLLEI